MITVPRAEQSVGTDAPQVPTIQAPRVVPGAFGIDVAAATQKAGETGVQLGDVLLRHIASANQRRMQAMIADSNVRLDTSFQDMAHSNEPATTFTGGSAPSNTAPFNPAPNSGPNDVGQVKGYLNRMSYNAKGITEDFVKNAAPLKSQFLEPFKGDPLLFKQASVKFDETYKSYYNAISAHEGNQLRIGDNNALNAQTVKDINSTISAPDVPSLLNGIKQITQSTNIQYAHKGAEQDEIDNFVQKNVGDAVSKAVVNKLTTTGDIKQAQAMLDAAKDSITPERYEKIDSMIDTGFTRLQQQAHVATVQKQISGQANLLTQLSLGHAGWMNIDDVANLVQQGAISEKFGKAYSDVIASKGNYQPREENNSSVPKFIEAIYHAKDQTQVHDTLISMMQEHKNMSQDEMAVLINSAMKRSNGLPLDLKLTSTAKTDPKQLAIDGGARQVVNFGRKNNLSADDISFMYSNYYNNVSKGISVPDAMEHATKQYVISKVPQAATMDSTPSVVVNNGSATRYYVGNESDSSKFPYIYDEANKRVIPNPSYKQKRPEKK